MKVGRVRFKGKEYKAVFQPDREIALLYESEFFDENIAYEMQFKQLEFLAPVVPSKIICVGFNYKDHVEELMKKGLINDFPKEPVLFLKGPNSITGHNQDIEMPKFANIIEFEGEFAVVMGRTCKDILPEDSSKYILGYTIGNDVTARDLQFKDGQWARAKSFDSFCPLGPWIDTKLNPGSLEIKTLHNNKIVQHSNTKRLMFDPFKLTAYVSWCMTLNPGDIIMTGTPGGVRSVRHGDTVEVEVEGLGSLVNRFKRHL